jgi:peptide methionine sulfoxide reductase msrA/msrB
MKILLIISTLILVMGLGGKPDVVFGAETKMKSEGEAIRIATFAGGCFWCVEADFEKLPGVLKVISGYTGGQ